LYAVCLLLVLAGCGAAAAGRPSPLRDLQRLTGPFHAQTALSTRVSADVAALAAAVHRGHAQAARRRAVTLKRDAWSLHRRSHSLEGALHAVLQRSLGRRAAGYVRALWNAVGQQHIEGLALVQLSDAVWADPRQIDSRNSAKISRAWHRARRAADGSVFFARQASWFRHTYPGALRYTVARH
jgi:hypothetical protein